MKIPEYQIVREIGQGGMAAVYLARHDQSQQLVAVKVMHANLIGDRSLVERFMREGRTHAGFKHPQIIRIYEVGQLEDGRPFFTMEYLEGETFKDFLATRGKLDPQEAYHLLLPIFSALAYVHEKRFIHRDVKPENIFLCRDRGAVLMDFGITKEADRNTRFTEAGMAIGTPHYMSPEQARGEPTDQRTDIYALGILLYEALAGRVPFDGKDSFAIAIKHIQEAAAPLPLDVYALQPVIDRALAKDPARRYSRVNQLQADFEKVLAGETPSFPKEEPPPGFAGQTQIMAAPSAGAESKRNRTKLVWLTLGVLLAGIGSFAAYRVFSHSLRRPVLAGGGGGIIRDASVERPASIPTSTGQADGADSHDIQRDELELKWQELKVLAVRDPVAAAREFGRMRNSVSGNPVAEMRFDEVRRQADDLFGSAALRFVESDQILSPKDGCAASLLHYWQTYAKDANRVDNVLRRGVARYKALAESELQNGIAEKARGYVNAAKELAGMNARQSSMFLAEADIPALETRIAEFEKRLTEQQKQVDRKRLLAKAKIDQAWELLDRASPWQARELVHEAKVLGADSGDLSGLQKALDFAIKDRRRQAEEMIAKARAAYEKGRYSQAIGYCEEVDREIYGEISENYVCDAARREKKALANQWQVQNQKEIMVEKFK
ncbi:MAG: serine/threonine-protein kinase [Syntrophotaleaceae bacterium]